MASSVFSDSRAATRARNAANSAAGEREPDPGEPAVTAELLGVVAFVLAVVLAVDALPRVVTQSFRLLRVIPRSAAIPRNVAPGVDSYNSTACRRNSYE